MIPVVVDFESYYDKKLSVKNLGNPNYAKDTYAYLIAILGDGIEVLGDPRQQDAREIMAQLAQDPELEFWAANSNFDQTLWEKYAPRTVHPWKCVLDLGAFHQFPRNVADLARVVLGRKVDKSVRDDMEGQDFDTLLDEDKKRVTDYGWNDVVQEMDLLKAMRPMSAIEEQIAAHTRMINRRGIHIDLEMVARDKTALEQMRFDALRAIPWHGHSAPLSYEALKVYCNSKGVPVPVSTSKTDEECADLVSAHPVLADVLGSMRKFRKANTMLKKADSLLMRVTDDGVLPLDLMYCGAPHTRRWSSRGFNVQNLDKEPIVVRPDLKVWTRHWLIPPAGKTFYIADFAQIEPRVLHWLANDVAMLELCRQGFSVYEAAARACKLWTGDVPLKKGNPDLYKCVKAQELGLGYGMGGKTYSSNNPSISEEAAEREVQEWRRRNPKITHFWRRMEALIKQASMDKDKHLVVDMPSGDLLQHFHIRSDKRSCQSFTIKGDFGHQSLQPRLWGGTLTENVVQRTARDLLADAVIRLENAGLPVLFHAHDEVIVAVDDTEKGRAEAKEAVDRIMATPPEWAADLPLASEGIFSSRYIK
jgi:DNA polymerase